VFAVHRVLLEEDAERRKRTDLREDDRTTTAS
jgi:hypothetical protein